MKTVVCRGIPIFLIFAPKYTLSERQCVLIGTCALIRTKTAIATLPYLREASLMACNRDIDWSPWEVLSRAFLQAARI